MKASVDQDGCISCGFCVSECPEVFSFDDGEKAQAIDDDIPDNLINDAENARDGCPVSVIDIK